MHFGMWLVRGVQRGGRLSTQDFGGCYLLTKEALDRCGHHWTLLS